MLTRTASSRAGKPGGVIGHHRTHSDRWKPFHIGRNRDAERDSDAIADAEGGTGRDPVAHARCGPRLFPHAISLCR
jgi:hypothetical protein